MLIGLPLRCPVTDTLSKGVKHYRCRLTVTTFICSPGYWKQSGYGHILTKNNTVFLKIHKELYLYDHGVTSY